MKKLALIVLITFCAASVFASGGKEPDVKAREVYKIKTFGFTGIDDEDGLAFLLDKFGLDIDQESIKDYYPGEWGDKPELIWASGDYPEFFEFYIQRIEQSNYPGIWDKIIDMKPHFGKVPNIRAMFTTEDWEGAIQRRSLPDGKLPYLFGNNYRVANTAWCYEKNTFDNLGIDEPRTLDDLYRALQVLRAEYPDPSYFLIGGREQFFNIFVGICYAYRVDPAFRLGADAVTMAEPFYVDPDTGKLTFGATTDKYLNALNFSKKLMDENLAPDMTTSLDEGIFWNEAAPNLKLFMSLGPTKDAAGNYNRVAAPKNPDVNWQVIKTPIAAEAGTKALVPFSPPDWDTGVFITDNASPEVRDRILEMINWSAGFDENGLGNFSSAVDKWLGNPTYEFNTDPSRGRVGAAMYPKEWALADPRPGFDSTRSPYWGEHGDGLPESVGVRLYPYRTPADWWVYTDSDDMRDYAEAVRSGTGDFTKVILWTRSPEEDLKLKELETAMAVIVNDFMRGFLKGEVSEAAWDDYKLDLKKAGLDEVMALRQKIYDRNN